MNKSQRNTNKKHYLYAEFIAILPLEMIKIMLIKSFKIVLLHICKKMLKTFLKFNSFLTKNKEIWKLNSDPKNNFNKNQRFLKIKSYKF